MAARMLIFAVAVLCFLHQGQAQTPTLSFSPPTLATSWNQSEVAVPLTITCSTTASGLLSMSLKRRPANSVTEILLVEAVAIKEGGAAKATTQGTQAGGIAGGSISDARITLSISRAKCADAMEYSCATQAYGTEGPISGNKQQNLTGEIIPGPATLILNSVGVPSGPQGFAVGDKAEFTCNAPVGSISPNTKIEFVWQFEASSALPSWVLYDSPDDIVTDQQPTPSNCQSMTMTSKLSRNVTIEDSLRRYRCYIKRNNQEYTELAGVASFETVTDPANPTNPGNSASNSSSPAKADVGMIIGIIIAILVVIAVVIVIVIFVVRRKRQQQNKDAYDSERKPENPSEPPAYPATETPVTYSKPRHFNNKDAGKGDQPRTGHANKGMDYEHDDQETREKEKRRHEEKARRNENDRYQGQSNRGYDRDGRNDRGDGRRYSSDDGGTDSRVNTSQLSIGDGDPTMGTAI